MSCLSMRAVQPFHNTSSLAPSPPGGLFERERNLPPLGSSLGLRPPPQNSSHYSATMATDLSLATALAAPPHPSSLLYSRHDPLGDGIGGRKGKKLFVRNVKFLTSACKIFVHAHGILNFFAAKFWDDLAETKGLHEGW